MKAITRCSTSSAAPGRTRHFRRKLPPRDYPIRCRAAAVDVALVPVVVPVVAAAVVQAPARPPVLVQVSAAAHRSPDVVLLTLTARYLCPTGRVVFDLVPVTGQR